MKQESEYLSKNRRFLVLARVGDHSLHHSWIADKAVKRTWDLQLNAYATDILRCQDGDLPPVFDYGTKWDSIVRHFMAYPELLDRYEYIMLPDDDLLMEAKDINRLFAIAVQYDLTMAQPAMTVESYMSHAIVLQMPGFRFRYSTFLESMACCIKSSYLRTLLPIFEQHFTGWGTDMIWALLMKDPIYRAAIVDEVPMTHTRPLYSGPIYNTFAKDKIDPHEEVHELMSAFENHPGSMQVYGGYLRNGRRVSAFEARMRNAIGLFSAVGNSKLPWNTFRMGCAMLVRAFTKMRYRPEQLRPLPGTKMAAFGMGAASRDMEISLPTGNIVTQISPVVGQSFSEGASV